jgi:hypothetical protein
MYGVMYNLRAKVDPCCQFLFNLFISVVVGSTMSFLDLVCGNDAILLRRRVSGCPGWNKYTADGRANTKPFDVSMRNIIKPSSSQMESGVGPNCTFFQSTKLTT